MSKLEIQWWFLNRIPFLWKLHARSLMPNCNRAQSIEAANTIWKQYNASVKATDRFSPLQIIHLEKFTDGGLSDLWDEASAH